MNTNELDEIEVVDLEDTKCLKDPIPVRIKYFLVRVDQEKYRVRSPIPASEILLVAGLDSCNHELYQRAKGCKDVILAPGQLVDLRAPGIESFYTKLKKQVTIVINGRQKVATKRTLSFSEIVDLEHNGSPPQGEFICFTITYSNGPCENQEGTLIEGQSVNIQCEMKFYVTTTDKS